MEIAIVRPPLLPARVRLVIYSFLTFKQLVQKVRVVSRGENERIQASSLVK